MRKLLYLSVGLALVIGLAASPAQAQFPKCLQFSNFCDAIQIDMVAGGVITAQWYSWDCAGTNCPMRGKVGVSAISPCDGSAAAAGIRGLINDGCPGDFWWAIDSLDGTMDMVSGVPPGGSCWIDQLSYQLLNGPCTGLGQFQPQKPSLLATLRNQE